jgi:ComF family protein
LPTQQDTCEACFLTPPALDRAIAAYSFDPTIRDAITALKYKDIRALSPRLGRLLADALPATVRDSVDVLIPVPLSRSRLRHRGYNQSELIARQIAKSQDSDSLSVETGLLARTLDSGPQAGVRSQSERAANVIGAFEVTGDVTDMRILLIDDVMTTGSTLNACAAVLKNAGADWVGALVAAREL